MLPGLGMLSWYKGSNDFVVTCSCQDHSGGPKCKKTRTGNKSKIEGRRPAQGRPLGHLMAWLEKQHDFATQGLHLKYDPDLPSRQGFRARLQEIPGSAFFFARERRPRDGEGVEPELLA